MNFVYISSLGFINLEQMSQVCPSIDNTGVVTHANITMCNGRTYGITATDYFNILFKIQGASDAKDGQGVDGGVPA